MLYRALSLSVLCSVLISAGDTPPNSTVEMVKQSQPKMPQVEFQQPYTNNGGGDRNSSSNIGSSAASSAANLLIDLVSVEQPDWKSHRRVQFKKIQEEWGVESSKTGWPELYEMFGDLTDKKTPMPVDTSTWGTPIEWPKAAAPVQASVPTPAPSAPVITPLPEAPKAVLPQDKSFEIFNPSKSLMPDDIIPHKPFIKPIPPTPTPAPTPTPVPTETQDPSLMMKMLKDGGEAAAIIGVTMAAGYVAYKTGEGVYKGGRWLWRKAFGEAEKQVVQQITPKSVHAQIEFHKEIGHCETPPKVKKKPGCLRAEAQLGDPRTRGLLDIEFPTDSSHIFRNEWGHFVHDTPETRGLLRDCYKKGTYHGLDGAGNHQYSMTNTKDGTQLWLKIRESGRISTAGCNEIHLPLSKETGFIFKPDCWKNPTLNGVGCTFVGGSLATMSSQVSKANIPDAVLFPVNTDPTVDDILFFNQSYKERFSPGMVNYYGMPANAPEGYSFYFEKNSGLILPEAPKAVTPEEIKMERASKMTYAIRMKKKNIEDYIVMEEMRRRNKQQAKVLKDAFFKKDNI